MSQFTVNMTNFLQRQFMVTAKLEKNAFDKFVEVTVPLVVVIVTGGHNMK